MIVLRTRLNSFVFAVASPLLLAAPAGSTPLKVVAAENFYGDVARQVGGPNVEVVSVLSNPDQDPHAFAVNPETARALASAAVVVFNGAGYDPWMEKLLKAHAAPARKEISVASLVGRKVGDNPHLWYDPANMKAAAQSLAAAFAAEDPPHKADYDDGARAFEASLIAVESKISDMRGRHHGAPVTASEPVFTDMAGRLGLKVRNERFAQAVMNGAEPSPSEVAAFEDDLRNGAVKAMLVNAQASEPLVSRLTRLAKQRGVPVVGVTETEPPGETYQAWMLEELDALDSALSPKS